MKAIIFDLDNTLFDSTELIRQARMEACEALIDAGLPAENKEEVYKKLVKIVERFGSNYSRHFSKLCREYGLKPRAEIIAAGIVAYHNIKISQLHLLPKARDLLLEFAKRDVKLALITTGTPLKQWEKVIRLNIKQYFDFISVLDDRKTVNKTPDFKRFMNKYRLKPEEVLCVGDRLDHEIYFGNKLGMRTVRILRGRHQDERPANRLQKPDFEIKEFKEIKSVLRHFTLLTLRHASWRSPALVT